MQKVQKTPTESYFYRIYAFFFAKYMINTCLTKKFFLKICFLVRSKKVRRKKEKWKSKKEMMQEHSGF